MNTSHKKSVDDYINPFPEEIKRILQILRKTIREELPNSEEVISYGIPTFTINGKYVVYFAAYKKHISIYPVSEEIMNSIEESDVYKKTGKGTIQFPIGKPLPLLLIRKIVRALMKAYKKRYPNEKI